MGAQYLEPIDIIPLKESTCCDVRMYDGVDRKSAGLGPPRFPPHSRHWLLNIWFQQRYQWHSLDCNNQYASMVCPLWGLNPWPLAHKTNALTTELKGLCQIKIPICVFFGWFLGPWNKRMRAIAIHWVFQWHDLTARIKIDDCTRVVVLVWNCDFLTMLTSLTILLNELIIDFYGGVS